MGCGASSHSKYQVVPESGGASSVAPAPAPKVADTNVEDAEATDTNAGDAESEALAATASTTAGGEAEVEQPEAASALHETRQAAELRQDFLLAPKGSKVDSAVEIHDVAERAITWKQLKDLRELIDSHCGGEGAPITDRAENKFDPWTKALASNPHQGKPLAFGKWDGNGWDGYAAEVCMYDIIDDIIKPLTQGPGSQGRFPEGCSYVETVAGDGQPAELFVSHFWAEPFHAFCEALRTYIQKQSLPDRTRFWIFGFAFRPWRPAEALEGGISNGPWYQVLQREETRATVFVTAFAECPASTRLWCLLEQHASVLKPDHCLDLVLCGPGAGALGTRIVCTTSGAGAKRGKELQSHAKGIRQSLEILLKVRAEDAGVSLQEDRQLLAEELKPAARDIAGFNYAITQRMAAPLIFHRALDGDAAGVKELLGLGPDLTYSTSIGTALHVATNKGRCEIVQLLLGAGSDVNSQATTASETPLHRAANFDHGEVAALLLAARADPALRTRAGLTALEVARKERSLKVSAALTEHKTAVERREGMDSGVSGDLSVEKVASADIKAPATPLTPGSGTESLPQPVLC